MQNKNQIYSKVGNVLTSQMDLSFSHSMSDFELASINSFKNYFPRCNISCCFFHFKQNIWRKIQSFGLATAYTSEETTRNYLKLIPSLAFCPESHVITYFEHTEDHFNQENVIEEFRPLLNYFEDNYIGRFGRLSRADPIFPISYWNQYNRVIENLPRTNNNLEGWHNGFNMLVNCSHPHIFQFLSSLKDEQSLIDVKIDNLLFVSVPHFHIYLPQMQWN
ncbi:hypothetical protein RF11_02737 [Thelohanellus kitauei]|uniref:MULE transposase domain-containing protein n=1 Tax=Thelohanellus kitauei TaxID=669202 RepID=A0A0C2MUG1_THEKT|nr:hypothetical protein RF11_02737 [Thelohanellus kitauei]